MLAASYYLPGPSGVRKKAKPSRARKEADRQPG